MASGERRRRPTFDSSTIFEDYTTLLDDETKELLQKDTAKGRISSHLKNGMYQPPMVNDSEKALITAKMKDKNNPDSTTTNSYFKQWHQSRRRTLDELESRGVLNPNFFNLINNKDNKTRNSEKAHEFNDLSIISFGNEEDDFEEMELNKNDLYYIHCHQIIAKQRDCDNIFINDDNKSKNTDNIKISITKETITPSAPPPTAVHTPLTKDRYHNNKIGFDRMQKVVKNKLERHSAKLEQKEMINLFKDSAEKEEELIEPKRNSHYSAQKSIQSLLAETPSNTDNNNINYSNIEYNNNNDINNAFNISYSSIPLHIDGGILSSSIFLSYKQHIESRIMRYTESAGECLDQMKCESNELEKLHRDTVHKSRHNILYDGVSSSINIDRNDHLKKLSQIDDNLADIRDKISRMVRVQKHIQFIESQYDTYIDGLRSDKFELLSILSELRDRESELTSIFGAVNEIEVWLITNIANIIAERSEKIDSLNRRLSFDCESKEEEEMILSVQTTKEFIDEVNVLIKSLSKITDNKRSEIQRLKKSFYSIKKQNKHLIASSAESYRKVIHRLYELQTHYCLPSIMESKEDIKGRAAAITSSLNLYLNSKSLNCNNYYNRSLDSFQTQIIYSKKCLKIFYLQYLLLINNVFIDCSLIHEYIVTNSDNKVDTIEREHNKQSSTALLNDVFTPISIKAEIYPLDHFNRKDPNTALNDVLNNNEFNIKFESIDFIKENIANNNNDILAKIRRISLCANIMCFRETVVCCLAQEITIKYKKEIQNKENEESIRKFATKYAIILLQNIVKSKKLIKSMKKMKNKKNVYKMAALILHNVYNIDIPFPM